MVNIIRTIPVRFDLEKGKRFKGDISYLKYYYVEETQFLRSKKELTPIFANGRKRISTGTIGSKAKTKSFGY